MPYDPIFQRPALLYLNGLTSGHIETSVLTLARALRRQGECPFQIACHFDSWFSRQAASDGFSVARIPYSRNAYKRAAELQQYISRGQFGLVHAHDLETSCAARIACRRLGVPLVRTFHEWEKGFWGWLDLRLRLRKQKFIAASNSIAAELRASGVKSDAISVVPGAVDMERFQSLSCGKEVREREGFSASDFVIGAFMRLAPESSPLIVLQAFAQAREACPNAKMLIVGDGPMKGVLVKTAQRLGIGERVIFAGSRDDIPSLYGAIDLLVEPFSETTAPQTILEAMWSGKAIIAARTESISDYLQEGREGLLVKAGDIGEWASSIKLLCADKAMREELAEAAHDRAHREFSSEAMARRVAGIYREALGQRQKSNKNH